MNSHEQILLGVSVAHQRATLDQLEQASVESQQEAVSSLRSHEGISEAFVLQTCNRVEAYVVADSPGAGRTGLDEITATLPEDIVRTLNHEESLRHLLRVAAGLESLVLGEDQILGQVRDAYEDAREADGIGQVLESGVTKAIRVGERARTETAINEGVVSLASAAVKLAAERHGLDGATVAVLGAGEMGTLAAKRVAPRTDQLVLLNRTESRAVSLAEAAEVPDTVKTAGLESLSATLAEVDVVISATGSSEPVIDSDTLDDAGETFIVDITRPRDVAPGAESLKHVTVYDLDSLESVTEKTRQMRRDAAARVEEIVEEEFDRLLVQYKRQRADRVISAMYESAERIKAAELEQTLTELDLDDEEVAAVESMADAIVSQLLAPPTDSLRDAAEDDDWSTIYTALQLFDPHFGPDEDPSSAFVATMQELDEATAANDANDSQRETDAGSSGTSSSLEESDD